MIMARQRQLAPSSDWSMIQMGPSPSGAALANNKIIDKNGAPSRRLQSLGVMIIIIIFSHKCGGKEALPAVT